MTHQSTLQAYSNSIQVKTVTHPSLISALNDKLDKAQQRQKRITEDFTAFKVSFAIAQNKSIEFRGVRNNIVQDIAQVSDNISTQTLPPTESTWLQKLEQYKLNFLNLIRTRADRADAITALKLDITTLEQIKSQKNLPVLNKIHKRMKDLDYLVGAYRDMDKMMETLASAINNAGVQLPLQQHQFDMENNKLTQEITLLQVQINLISNLKTPDSLFVITDDKKQNEFAPRRLGLNGG